MALTSGTQLGPYEILAPVGKGGMGEVYRAKDTRLDREVAIKVLPENLAADAEALKRFEREAKAVAALSHPNILTIHDVGSEQGVSYAVMELLEGETLRTVIDGKPVPWRKAVEIASAVAEGLAAAHSKGIIHRDLKPENIFLTSDDRVKILDFGLARFKPQLAQQDLSEAPTESKLTESGIVMGTVPYMSPEQVRGESVDARTDIFALGCVLYEMITGHAPFSRPTAADTVSAILKEEPQKISEWVTNVPVELQEVNLHCLEKDPRKRFQSSQDLVFALRQILRRSAESDTLFAATGQVQLPVRRGFKRLWQLIALMAVLAAVILALTQLKSTKELPSVVRLSLLPPPGTEFSIEDVPAPPALSPDGRLVVFGASDSSGDTALWVRSLNSFEAKRVTGTDRAWFPFWSPDGRYIGFFADGKLKKVQTSGGVAQELCDAPVPFGGSWGPGGIILFARYYFGTIYKVSEKGGTPIPVTRIDPKYKYFSHCWPSFLPDGRHFLFTARETGPPLQGASFGVFIGSIEGGDAIRLLPEVSNALYSCGYVLYSSKGTLMALPFDAKRLMAIGESRPLASGIEFTAWWIRATFSASSTGMLAYRTNKGLRRSRLAWMDRSGKILENLSAPSAPFYDLRLSPDGRRVACAVLSEREAAMDIWMLDLTRNVFSRLTLGSGFKGGPVWSPDARRIVFWWGDQIYMVGLDGARQELLRVTVPGNIGISDWSRDGNTLLVTSEDAPPGAKGQVWTYSLKDGVATPLLRSEFEYWPESFSPDGRWIAFTSDESGHKEVYVLLFGKSGAKWQISTAGGTHAKWTRDGREIVYLGPDRTLMSVAVQLSATFTASRPKPLFKLSTATDVWEIGPSADRFLVALSTGEDTGEPLNLILNWPQELQP